MTFLILAYSIPVHALERDWDWTIIAEPFFGIKTGTATQGKHGQIVSESIGSQEWSTDAPSFGMRAGLRGYEFAFFGLEYSYARTDFDIKTGATPNAADLRSGFFPDATFENNKFGPYLGAHLPIFPAIRGWIGYNFIDNLTQTNAPVKFSGYSYRFGASYSLKDHLPFPFAVNFEYISATYDKYSDRGTEYDLPRDVVIGATTEELKTKTYFFSISIPLEYELISTGY